MAGQQQIRLINLAGNEVASLQVSADLTVGDLKQLLQRRQLGSVDSFALVWELDVLQDSTRICTLGLPEDATLQLVKFAKEPCAAAVYVMPGPQRQEQEYCLAVDRERSLATLTRHFRGEPSVDREFPLDAVYDTDDSLAQLFEASIRPLAEDVLEGVSSTVLLYGTKQGRLATVVGSDEARGILQLIAEALIEKLDALPPQRRAELRISALEVPGEGNGNDMQDLLNVRGPRLSLSLQPLGIAGLSWRTASSARELRQAISDACITFRRPAAEDPDELFCPGHVSFSITVEMHESRADGSVAVSRGTVQVVSLADSDPRAPARGSFRGFCNVVATLSLGGVARHGESALTVVLREALGGCARALFVGLCRPGLDTFQDELSTLQFISRARKVHNAVRANLQTFTQERAPSLDRPWLVANVRVPIIGHLSSEGSEVPLW